MWISMVTCEYYWSILPGVSLDMIKMGDIEGFNWNVAISTRFWQDSLLSIETNIPLDAGLSWPARDNSSGMTVSWYKALNGIALDLTRYTVHWLVQGKHRMSTDVHRAHFRQVTLPREFIEAVLSRPELRKMIVSKSPKEILKIPNRETAINVEPQNCTTTWPHCSVEDEATSRRLRAKQEAETRLLEPNDSEIAHMLDIVGSEIE